MPKLSKYFAPVLVCLVCASASLRSAHARQTNDTQSAESPRHKFFEFDGGTPFDFIKALDLHFRTRLVQVLTLPETLRHAEVPRLRVAVNQPQEVLNIYNRLDNPELGTWKYEPENGIGSASTNLGVLALVPDKSIVTSKMERNTPRVQALPLGEIDSTKWDALSSSIEAAVSLAAQSGLRSVQGRFFIQRDSQILIAAGPEAYIDAVSSVVSAYKENAVSARTKTAQK
jgi:hypothetical protein